MTLTSLLQDFRSQDGLYSLINTEYNSQLSASGSSTPATVKGKDLFDSNLWKDELSTSVFYTFIASLRRKIREEVKETSATHKFIRQIRDKGKLVRCYTQNIDGLEARESLCMDLKRGKGSRSRFTKKSMQKPVPLSGRIPGSDNDGGCETVQLHGNLDMLRCSMCGNTSEWEDQNQEALFLKGESSPCRSCAAQNQDRQDRGKRGTSVGTLRPNVVLYGEEHPSSDLLSSITKYDLGLAPDVLLVCGTSLKVHGLKVLVKEFAKAVKSKPNGKGRVIFVNLTRPPGSVWNDVFDYWVGMDCDAWVNDVQSRRPDMFLNQAKLNPGTAKPEVSMPAKSKQSSMGTDDTLDKENMVTVPVLPKALRTPKSRRFSKPLTPLSQRNGRGTNALQESTPSTRGRGRPCKAPLTPSQQPTPPSSASKRPEHHGAKRPRLEEEDYLLQGTPSKRLKQQNFIIFGEVADSEED